MNFLKNLLGRGCAHRFAWPRMDDNGRYYQICLGCGAAYEYDWNRMQRTDRVLTAVIQRGLQGDTCSHVRGLWH